MRKSEREELVSYLAMRAFLSCVDPRKPGVLIQKLPSKIREKLKELTSDDFKNIRY